MTKFELYQHELSKLEYNAHLRYGQQCFNLLYEIAPEIANDIRGTEIDPFYQDENLPAFFKYLGVEY